MHLGTTGCQLVEPCWRLYSQEQDLSPAGVLCNEERESTVGAGRYFAETDNSKYTSRSVVFDFDPSVVDELRIGRYRELFNPDNLISGLEDTASNWAKGHWTMGRQKLDHVWNVIRKEMEKCDSLENIIYYHSTGGGTGAGFTGLLLYNIYNESKNVNKVNMAIYPSPRYSNVIVEPYNCVLLTEYLNQYLDCSILLNNEALYRICTRHLGIEWPTFRDINDVISHVSSSLTVASRTGNGRGGELREILTNLVPYPRIHYPVISYAPFMSPDLAQHEQLSLTDITRQSYQPGTFIGSDHSRI